LNQGIAKKNNGQKLQEEVILLVQKRLYLEAINYTIVSLREDFKEKWIKIFHNPEEFPDKESALNRMKEIASLEFKAFSKKVSQQTTIQETSSRFQKFLDKMTGGKNPVQWGSGMWLHMISGKKPFHLLVSHCFHVEEDGKILQGKEAINAVAINLMRTGRNLPEDLIELKRLIKTRIETTY